MDSKLIGWYEDNSFGSFPGFTIKIISAYSDGAEEITNMKNGFGGRLKNQRGDVPTKHMFCVGVYNAFMPADLREG
jgi:hypothetical protein